MGIPLVDGRDFGSADLTVAESTSVLVNRAFARRYFDRERAAGRDFLIPTGGQELASPNRSSASSATPSTTT